MCIIWCVPVPEDKKKKKKPKSHDGVSHNTDKKRSKKCEEVEAEKVNNN